MGICISSASREIHHQAEDDLDNVIYLQETNGYDASAERFGSVFCKQGSKGLNQDATILHQGYGMENGVFCGVFDGHGKNGHIVSKIVRNRLPSLILDQKNAYKKREQYVQNESVHQWKEACISAFKVMDKEINLYRNLDCSCSGTTAVVVIKQGDDIVIGNLGDSRAVLGTFNGSETVAVQLTKDLKPNVSSEAERIRKCNGRVIALKEEPHIHRVWLPHEDTPGLAMSRSFGDFLLKLHGVIAIPEIYFHRLNSNDEFIVLASDGVWDVLANDEVISIVSKVQNKEEAAEAIVESAVATWKRKFPSSKIDDCTAICLFFQNGN